MTVSPRKRRTQPPDIRRRQILDSAEELLTSHGFERMTMDQVARSAGVAKGTVYLYFDSKKSLLAGLQADLSERMMAGPRALLEDDSLSWTERLDDLVAQWIGFDLGHIDLYHVLFHELGVVGDDPMVACRQLLIEILEGGRDAGEFDVEDSRVTASFLLHGYAGPCFHEHDHGHDPPDSEHLTWQLQALFRRVAGVKSGVRQSRRSTDS